jgi:hypothetical protein
MSDRRGQKIPLLDCLHSYVTLGLKASPEAIAQPLENRGHAWYSEACEWVNQYIRALD